LSNRRKTTAPRRPRANALTEMARATQVEVDALFCKLDSDAAFTATFNKLVNAGVCGDLLKLHLTQIAVWLRTPSRPTTWTKAPVGSWRSLKRTFVKRLGDDADWIERLQRDCLPLDLVRWVGVIAHPDYSADMAHELEWGR
jgi:hypothetical protein